MGLGFRKSISLGKGVRLNFSKSGIGMSAGVKGFRVGAGSKGIRMTSSIPGTGLFYTKQYGNKKNNSGISPMLILFFILLYIFFPWAGFFKILLIILPVFFIFCFIIFKKYGNSNIQSFSENKIIDNTSFTKKELLIKNLDSDLIEIINANLGILQKDIYSYFDEEIKTNVIKMLSTLEKEEKIIRIKKGNTYQLYIK